MKLNWSRLKSHLNQKKLTVNNFVKKAKIGRTYLYMIKNGKRPSSNFIEKVLVVTELKFEDLFFVDITESTDNEAI